MKYFFLSFLLISLYNANGQINGTWYSDWQNNYYQDCTPSSFVIGLTGPNTADVAYNYSSSTFQYCSILNITSNFTSTLTSNELGVWNDAFGLVLIYNSTSNTISYTVNNVYQGAPFLFTTNGAALPEQSSLGSIGGTWTSPTAVSSTANNSACCIPNTLFVMLTSNNFHLNVEYDYVNNPNCNNSNASFQLSGPNANSLNWQSLGGVNMISFAPLTSVSQLTAAFGLQDTCQYTYQRTNPQTFTGTWEVDWQSALPSTQPISSYQVSAANVGTNFYMTSVINDSNGTTTNSYVVQTPSGQYYDSFFNGTGALFNYSQATNTLLLTDNILLSTNGSILPQQAPLGAIGGTWINASPVNSSADESDCCIPENLFITQTGQQMNINGVFTYANGSNCSTENPSTLSFSLMGPNPETLTWGASSGIEISVTPYSTLNQILVNLNSSTSCQFYYAKSNVSAPISGTWEQDWQDDNLTSAESISSYQISTVTTLGASYMVSNITNTQNVSTSSYVVVNPEGEYYDVLFNGTGATFTYDQTMNSLMGTNNYLLSPNGALFSSTPFIQTWTNAVALNSTSLPEGCCVPTSVVITNNNNSTQTPLQVTYTLPSNYQQILGCNSLASDINNGAIQSTISVQTPSDNQLTYVDQFGAQLFFPGGNFTQLAIANFDTGCSFGMTSAGGAASNSSSNTSTSSGSATSNSSSSSSGSDSSSNSTTPSSSGSNSSSDGSTTSPSSGSNSTSNSSTTPSSSGSNSTSDGSTTSPSSSNSTSGSSSNSTSSTTPTPVSDDTPTASDSSDKSTGPVVLSGNVLSRGIVSIVVGLFVMLAC